MMDAMLVVHHCAQTAKAEFCRVPDSPLDPTVWVDPSNALVAWHPLMLTTLSAEPKQGPWEAQEFADNAAQIRDGIADHIYGLFEESGTPVSYYSNYPSIVEDLRNQRTSFTQPATEEDDKAADKEMGRGRAPSLAELMARGRSKKATR